MSLPHESFGRPDQPCYTALTALSDEVVMSFLAEGNHDALAVIFDRYRRLVIRVAMQILRQPAEAEDVMQSVFITILETATKFDAGRGTLRVWLLQHAYHQALNRRRYLSLRGMYDAATSDSLDGVSLGSSTAMPALESKRVIQQALTQLSSRQRETLELAFYEGWTLLEISEKTRESYANTRHHYYRGLERMRLVLSNAHDGKRPSSASNEERAYAGS
jgi:RNA polymerase sigma-70 factor (ECF subfamily)